MKKSFGENCRCGICNRVSHSDIASDYGEFSSTSFHPDPNGKGFLCSECYNSIEEIKYDWAAEEDTSAYLESFTLEDN